MRKTTLVALLGATMGMLSLPAASEPFLGTSEVFPGYRLLFLDDHPVKWGAPVMGSGAVVTYTLVTDFLHFDGARNCAGIGPLDTLLTRNGVSRPVFDRELDAALDAWTEAADISFRPADPKSAEILIGSELQPRGRAFTNVADDAAASAPGPRRIDQALICLNPMEAWKVGFGGNADAYDLRYSLMHEIGHAIGLDHPGQPGEVMYFKYSEDFRGLQPGDIKGAVALYGPAGAGAAIALQPTGTPARTERALGSETGQPAN